MSANAVSGNSWPGVCRRRSPLIQTGCAALVLIAVVVSVPRSIASAAVPEGVWLIENEVAVQIFECGNFLCGRIVWLMIPRDPEGWLVRDKNNPEPALQQRPLCGLTIFWAMRPNGPGRWTGGWFYNPDDGRIYNVSAELRICRHDRSAHLSGHPALWADQDYGPRTARHICRMVLNEGKEYSSSLLK